MYRIDIQKMNDGPIPLSDDRLTNLAVLALTEHQEDAELTIRLVNSAEIMELNHLYRKQNKTTNVLAFPANLPPHITLDCPFLGDVVICPEVVSDESEHLNKSIEEHWSLIVIHGVLHLLGHDHINDEDAVLMQAIEVNLLAKLGFANPYELEENHLE